MATELANEVAHVTETPLHPGHPAPGQPVHHRPDGTFDNPWPEWEDKGLSAVYGWLKHRRENKTPPRGWLLHNHKPQAEDYARVLPVNAVDYQAIANPPADAVQLTWAGHACCLVQLEGVTFLTDPALSKRCSGVQWFGPSRLVANPLDVDHPDLQHLDFVVISHDHYDHLDAGTVKRLNSRFGKALTWYVPLGLKRWFTAVGVATVVELDWWQSVTHPGTDVRLTFTPAQHWSMRVPWARKASLWGGWAVHGRRRSFWFAGDTGYCQIFKEIGVRLGPFDLAAIPIGAYEPRTFLRPQHINPEEAVLVHQAVGAKRSVGIHFGTFPLGDEASDAAPVELQRVLRKSPVAPTEFLALQHGTTLRTAGGADLNSPPLLPVPSSTS